MDCRQVRKQLEKYSDSEMAASSMAAVAKHLDSCATCQTEYARIRSTQARIQERFEVMPNLKAAPDFDLRVLDRVLPQLAQPDSFFDRLDAIFARPLYKLLGSTALGLFLALLTVAAVLLPQSLGGSTRALPAMTASTAVARDVRTPDNFYAGGLLPNAAYADLMRELYPVESTPPPRQRKERRESAWDADTSELSYSSRSGSLC